MSNKAVEHKATSKMAIALNISETLNRIIANQLPSFVRVEDFEVISSINGHYVDSENNISFVVPNCTLNFKKNTLSNITLPSHIEYRSTDCSSEEISNLLEKASITLPFDLINFVQQAQKDNISKIIKNNIAALGVEAVEREALVLLGSILAGKNKIKSTLTMIEDGEASTKVKVEKEIDSETVFHCIVEFKKREITPYQTVFYSGWDVSAFNHEKAKEALQWLLSNMPELLQTTEDLTRPVSSLHFEVKEFLNNKKTA